MSVIEIGTPALGAEYQGNFNKLIANINNNFKTLVDKITADNLIQNTTIENTEGKLPGLLEALGNKLKLSSNSPQYNNLKSINITYYEYPDGTLHIPATTIIDEHYYNQIDNQTRSNLTDYTCMFTGIYNGKEWNISTLNSFPKIVYNNGGFVWQIGETITSINAQGLKGDKGDNTSVTALTTVFVNKVESTDNGIKASVTGYINNEGNKENGTNDLISGTPAICVATVDGNDNIYSGYVVASNNQVTFNGQKMILLQAISEDDINSIWNDVFNS